MQADAVVVGGGAAGLMCAIEAGKRGRGVVVIENGDRIGRKILISGGGRCNFTNLHTGPANFLSANPHFAKSALARYTPADFLDLVRKHGIAYHEKTLGQLFCDRSASDITRMLEAECASAGVRIVTGCQVSEVRRDAEWTLDTSHGVMRARSLVIATGGLSVPKTGATDFGYRIARQFGVAIEPCRAALVPLIFGPDEARRFGGLAGVSADVMASADGAQFREKMLFTHRGLSGPAILQVSSYWQPGGLLTIDLLPGAPLARELLRRKRSGERAAVKTVLAEHLPKRLADILGGEKPLAAAGDRELEALAEGLHRWCIQPAGTEGYAKAEVTAGGVSTRELSSQTMECRAVPGLYFIGEVVDVTGQLGGFNFQWAWASGWCAGQFT